MLHGLDEIQKFSKQHSIVSLGDNTILLYDNGNSWQRSRILKIRLDEQNKMISEYEEFDLDTYANMMGSVRLLGDNTYLISYGGGKKIETSIAEINYQTNESKFKFTFHDEKYRWMYNVNKSE